MRGLEAGPFQVIADASPSYVHARLLGLGCGDEVVLYVPNLVPAEPGLEAYLAGVTEKVLAGGRARSERARLNEERQVWAAVRELVHPLALT